MAAERPCGGSREVARDRAMVGWAWRSSLFRCCSLRLPPSRTASRSAGGGAPGQLYRLISANMAVANVMGALETTFLLLGTELRDLAEAAATTGRSRICSSGRPPCSLDVARRGRGRARAPRPRLLTAVLVVALLALWAGSRPRSGAFAYVPGIDLFRRPATHFVAAAMLAILVGHLLADYCQARRAQMPWWRARRRWRGEHGRDPVGHLVLGRNGPRGDAAVEELSRRRR